MAYPDPAAGTPAATPPTDDSPVVLDRRDGPYGEVVLRAHGGRYEIIANGCFLMDTSDGRSERLLVDVALAALDSPGGPREGLRLLIGGLGVGFSLARAAAEPRWGEIAVVERETAVIDWHRSGPLAAHSANALDDPRVHVVQDDLVGYVRDSGTRFDALCLDIDNGPDWTVTENNGTLYSPSGLLACRERLEPAGVLAVWSAQPSADFEAALRDAGFADVHTIEVPVTRGVPDVVHVGVKA
ncbi:spermidine synthase [Actinacidiphila acidipaludis]|uniref:Spermidine synthase n=1 Tax=Actinacidiphila acidipaludis TaxID=2873382 RepID=A0ABS7QHK1_9ACTN|nr:spermidine synthase [Streptomyces acidipaludis]MBY8882652.1 spermidine synthase [Streptomyces acidipaludis]